MVKHILFDLDGTLRKNHFSPILNSTINLINKIKHKHKISIITDNEKNKEDIEKDIKMEVISPITQKMNPNNRDWFVYDNAVYIIRFFSSHEMVDSILKYKIIRVIDNDEYIESYEYNKYPNVKLPYVGVLSAFFQKHYGIKVEIIGKKVKKMNGDIMVGNSTADELFAKNNKMKYIDVNKSNIDVILKSLL